MLNEVKHLVLRIDGSPGLERESSLPAVSQNDNSSYFPMTEQCFPYRHRDFFL